MTLGWEEIIRWEKKLHVILRGGNFECYHIGLSHIIRSWRYKL